MTAAPSAPSSTAVAFGSTTPLVTFRLDEQRFALRLSAVERVLPMIEVTPLPQAPGIVVGVINLAGDIVAVLDIRTRFGLPRRSPTVADHLLVARTRLRSVAFIVDQVAGVVETAQITSAGSIADVPYFEGVARFDDGLVLIHDLDTFLSSHEANSLDAALASTRAS